MKKRGKDSLCSVHSQGQERGRMLRGSFLGLLPQVTAYNPLPQAVIEILIPGSSWICPQLQWLSPVLLITSSQRCLGAHIFLLLSSPNCVSTHRPALPTHQAHVCTGSGCGFLVPDALLTARTFLKTKPLSILSV